jgi:hypothetical protein
MEGYHASPGPDSFLIRKEMGPSPVHSNCRKFPSTMSPTQYLWHLEINMPMPTEAQTVPLADPHWDQNDESGE